MLPLSWTTAGRPPKPQTGLVGWNRTLAALEVWNGAAWVAVGGGGGGGAIPDFASITMGPQDFLPDPDPLFLPSPGQQPDATGHPYGWILNPFTVAAEAIVATVPLPSNADLTRNPRLHVVCDDGGAGTGLANYALEVAIEDVACGAAATSGVRGAYPGMTPVTFPDTTNLTTCTVFTGSAPWPGNYAAAHVSIRRPVDTSPSPLIVVGATLELPVSA